jgi:hypothetical protein
VRIIRSSWIPSLVYHRTQAWKLHRKIKVTSVNKLSENTAFLYDIDQYEMTSTTLRQTLKSIWGNTNLFFYLLLVVMIANDGIQFLAMAMSEFFAAIWVYCFTTVIKQNTHVLKQCKRLYWGDDDLPMFRQYWVTKENLDWFTNGTSSHLEK